MRTIKEVLRLRHEGGLSHRAIAQSCGIAASTVGDYLKRAAAAGLSWPLRDDLGEEELERLLFSDPGSSTSSKRPLPDWATVHQEMGRKGVTLSLLWQEYKAAHPEGYEYSQFCDRYRCWKGSLDVCLRQDHKAGEKLFVDYAGQTQPVTDPASGEIRQAQIFVAVLGASNYTYAEATWTQGLEDWVASHIRTWEFLGGATELVVPDNLKSAVSSPSWYEPDLNPTYHEAACHYGTAVLPARVRKPRDKAKVEVGVLGAERWLLAPLRNRAFFSLSEVNQAIRELLVAYNDRPFQKLPGSRRSLFESVEKAALKPLPSERYEYAEWKKARVNIDYHIEFEKHYYSVPYRLVRKQIELRVTATVVECFHKGKRVASHVRSSRKARHTTVKEHMPKGHREYVEWTPERLVRWARKTGGTTAEVIEYILSSRVHPQQGFRACLGILRLGKRYGNDRLEAACKRAQAIRSMSYRSIESILKQGLDRQPLPNAPSQLPAIEHANVRGAEYYQEEENQTQRRTDNAQPINLGETPIAATDGNAQGPGRTDGNAAVRRPHV
jgi:transposase